MSDIDALKVARFMYERQCAAYDAAEEQTDEVWRSDPLVRQFWIDEAEAVLGFLGFAKATR